MITCKCCSKKLVWLDADGSTANYSCSCGYIIVSDFNGELRWEHYKLTINNTSYNFYSYPKWCWITDDNQTNFKIKQKVNDLNEAYQVLNKLLLLY